MLRPQLYSADVSFIPKYRPSLFEDDELVKAYVYRREESYLEQVLQLVYEGLVAEGDADVRHVGVGDVVAFRTLALVLRTKPVLLHLREAGVCKTKRSFGTNFLIARCERGLGGKK